MVCRTWNGEAFPLDKTSTAAETLQTAHAGEKIPIYQQSLCGTPGDGKHSWCENKKWFRVSCSTKRGEEKHPSSSEEHEGEQEQSHSSEDQQPMELLSHPWGEISPSLPLPGKGFASTQEMLLGHDSNSNPSTALLTPLLILVTNG